jgi:hypothetical protein
MAISRSDMNRQLYDKGGRAEFAEGGIMPRLNELGSNVSSAEQMLQQINQRLQSAESNLGGGGGTLANMSNANFNTSNVNLSPLGPGKIDNQGIGPDIDQLNVTSPQTPVAMQTPLQTALGLADGGRAALAEGGIITLEDAKKMAPPGESLAYINPEEAALLKSLGGAGEDVNGTGIKSYFFKKIFKKAKKAVKKVVKSPIGKAALLAAPFLMSGAGAGSIGKFFGKGSFNPFMAKGKFSGLGSLLNKAGLVSGTGGFTGLGKLASIAGVSGLGGLLAAKEQDEDDVDISDIDRGEGMDIPDIIRRARLNDSEFRFLPGAGFTNAYAEGGEVGGRKIMVDRLEVEVMPDESEERAMLDAMMNDIDEVMPEDRKMEFYRLLIPQLRRSGEMSDSEYEGLMGELFGEGKADGGIMNLGGNEMDLRGGGFVPLGAKEKADDVPARLSKNEFVMTADAVRAAGGGSVDKGADKMYKMMKNLEAQV